MTYDVLTVHSICIQQEDSQTYFLYLNTMYPMLQTQLTDELIKQLNSYNKGLRGVCRVVSLVSAERSTIHVDRLSTGCQ